MRPLVIALALLFGMIRAWSQSPPAVQLPPGNPPALGPRDEWVTMRGTIVAYDWSTRYYMEGARVENFVFKATDNARETRFVRVVSVWHPADKRRLLPNNFYSPHAVWEVTLNATSPYDFVRQYCLTLDAPTFSVDVGNGNKVELRRYVSPAVLSPDVDLTTNFKKAIAKRPASPEMPNPSAMQCMYLEKVKSR